MKQLDVVEIWWVDSQADSAWTPKDSLPEDPKPIPAVGILISESSQFITLCISFDPTIEECIPVLTIPKPAIRKRKVICRLKMKT